jgi:beta-lactamase class A
MRVFAVTLFCAFALPAQTAVELLEQKTLARIAAFDAKLDGVLGVAAIDLSTGRRWSYHGGTVFPQASSIKIPIMIEMFKAERAGAFSFDDRVTLAASEYVGGSGDLQKGLLKGPVNTTIRELVSEMIRSSDNTATNWCIRKVGMAAVNRTLDELNLIHTRLRRIMLDSAAASRNEENVSTPDDMATLAELIYRHRAVDAAATLDMANIMKTVNADFRKAIPASIEVAAKPGEVSGVRCETGIIYLPGRPYALSVMTTFLGEEKSVVGEVATIVHQHFERLARGNQFGNLGTR